MGTWYFLEKWEEQGGLTGAQAEQEASLAPRPREILKRGQLAELWFPVVSRVLQQPLPTGGYGSAETLVSRSAPLLILQSCLFLWGIWWAGPAQPCGAETHSLHNLGEVT